MAINETVLSQWFRYQPQTDEQIAKCKAIRKAGHELAKVIVSSTPRCPDQSHAIRKVREAVMMANAAISFNGGCNHE